MQSIAAEFIQVRIHLVFVLTQSGKTRSKSFRHWCGCCRAKERGPRSRSYPQQRPINDHTHYGTCEDQFRHPKTAEVCVSIPHTGCDSPPHAKSNPEPN